MLRHRELFTHGSGFTGQCSPSPHSLIHTQCWQVALPPSNLPLLTSQTPSCLGLSLSLSLLTASSLASLPLGFPTNPASSHGQGDTCSCTQSSVTSDSVTLWLRPTRLLHSWNFPGKNTGVSCHFLLQGFSPPRGGTWISCVSPSGRQIVYLLSYWESSRILCG